MEPTALRDVFKCITLSIAAMEDVCLQPKPSSEPPTLGPPGSEAPGQRHRPPALLNTAVKHVNPNMQKAGAGRRNASSSDPSKWKQNQQKQLRMEGKAYVTKRKKDGEVVTKHPRFIGPRCSSNACQKASNRLCDEISEEGRRKAFEDFWQRMDWAQRKLYVGQQVDRDPVERSRATGSRRSASLRYHLMVDGRRKQVCKNMFLSTLGIGQWSVLSWAQRGGRSEANETRKVGPQCPQPNPAACHTADVRPEPVNATDRPPEPDGSARKKSRVAKPLTWKQNRQKQLRMEGKPYVSKRKKDGTTVTKGQRTMGPGCTSGACKRASNRYCGDFSEAARNRLFSNFWQSMNWAQRKTFVSGLVDCDPVERTRAPWTQSRRSVSMRYHLIADGNRKQVCKKMFLSTLGVGEWSVLNWAQNTSQQPDDSAEIAKKRTKRKSRKASEHAALNEFLQGLPKVRSQCCDTSVSKLYLEPAFSNMSEVYRHYLHHCTERQTAPLSRQVFCAVFKKMDLRLCDHKKDQSLAGASGNLFTELWEEYCLERGRPGSPAETAGQQ